MDVMALGVYQNINTTICTTIFRLEVRYRYTGAKYRYLVILKLWSVCVCYMLFYWAVIHVKLIDNVL